jgi:hypothetical protein
LGRVKSPNLPYDIAVLPPEVPENYHQERKLQERFIGLLQKKGLRVVPVEQLQRALKLLHGGRLAELTAGDFNALSHRLRCRYVFLFKLAHLQSRKHISLGKYATTLGRVLIGGLLLGLRSSTSDGSSLPWGVLGGLVAGGAVVMGVSVTAEAGFQGRIYDALNHKTLWKGTGGAQNSKQFLGLFASKDTLCRQTVQQALESLLNPPPDVFPMEPWATLDAPNSEEEMERSMQHTLQGNSAWDRVPTTLKGKYK